MKVKILNLSVKIIKDSLDKNTLEVELETNNGKYTSSCPSGESVGTYEAVLVEPKKGMSNINDLNKQLVGFEFENIDEIDNKLLAIDGTGNKSKLGANAMLPISISAIKALSGNNKPLWKLISEFSGCDISLPTLMMVMIEGGKHSYFEGIKWQEFLLNSDEIDDGKKFLNLLKVNLEENNIDYRQGYEGGYSINLKSNIDALNIFTHIFSKLGKNLTFSLDIAATHNAISNKELNTLINNSSIATIEDPISEEDWDGWVEISQQYGKKVKFIGDDLTVTNTQRLQKAIDLNACQGLIIKPNQIGTVSQTLQVAKLATKNNLIKIVSHRAKDTNDDFIADLAVGIGAQYLKSGAPTQPERLAKYNRLEKIKSEFKE